MVMSWVHKFFSFPSHPCFNQLSFNWLVLVKELLSWRADVCLWRLLPMVVLWRALLNLKLALGNLSLWVLRLVPFPNIQRGAEALNTHLSADEMKTVQLTQSSGFYYWSRVILKLPFKIVAVRFKDANLHTRGCKLMARRMHLACRYVFFAWSFIFFKFWISCQYLKFGKYHTKCQTSRFSGKIGSHSCLALNEKRNASCHFRQS